MATSDSYPRDESMRPGAMSGAPAPTTGASAAPTAGGSYSGSMRTDGGSSTDDTVLDRPREVVGQVADQAQQKLMQAAETAQDTAKSQLGGQLEQVSEALESVADAMSSVGKQLREKDQGQLAGLADQAAHQVEHFSGYVKGRDVDQLIGDVERFARRQPMVFVGGAFVLGLMAARFLKSSRPEPEMRYRPYLGPDMRPGMRPSYGARPYASGGYPDAPRGSSYGGGMSSAGSMRRASDYSAGGYANGGPSVTNRPGTGAVHAGTGSAPAPSGSPAHVTGSGSMAGSQRPASSGTGTSAGWGSTSGGPAPTPASGSTTSHTGSPTPTPTTPSRPTGQPYGPASTDRPEEGR